MANMYEDFRRCAKCGHADFKEETLVTIPKVQRKRDEFHRHEPVSNIGKEIIYTCAKCGERIDL